MLVVCTAAAERAGIVLDIAMVHTDQRTAAARLYLLWSHHWHKRLSRYVQMLDRYCLCCCSCCMYKAML
jgi:hypothetical protein